MRNLKRALSLALATVMTMGLMMVGTGASYKDVKTSHNVEAIEVLQTVGIMTGDENGNFNPDKSVTRNEMAVVMSNLLKLDYNYYRGTNPFADVPSWAAPYVAACAAEGIVSGVGGNLYNGEGNVTAAQASLMIMKALGYFQYQADFGDDWQIATIRQASQINLLDGINAKAEDALTRNQIAQLVLNGLKAKMVSFTGDVGTEATIGGATINIGYRAEYTPKTNAAAKYDSIDLGTTNIAQNDQYYVQLGEELYNGDLKLKADTDVFGRPARYWEYDGKEIGTYAKFDQMVKEYTTEVTGKDLYDVLTSTTIKDYDLTVYIDGVSDKDVNKAIFEKADMNKNNKDTVGETGNGVLTQVFVDNDKKDITVSIINTYLAIADEDYSEKKDEVTLTVYGLEKKGDEYLKVADSRNNTDDDSLSMKLDGEDFAIASEIVEDDALLVTVADGEIQTAVKAEIVSDVEITAFKKDTSVTADGTKYDYADTAEYDREVLDQYTSTGNATTNLKNTTYNVYLDSYGYAIAVDQVETPKNYMFITGVDDSYSNLGNKNVKASAIFLDGTMKTIDITTSKGDGENLSDDATVNSWFTYTVDKDGIYTVTEVASAINVNRNVKVAQAADATRGNGDSQNIDKRHIFLNGAGTDGYDKVYGNDDTIYLTASIKEIKTDDNRSAIIIDEVDSVTTGLKNANIDPWNAAGTEIAAVEATYATSAAATDGVSAGVYTLYKSNGYIIATVVVGEDATASKNLVYVTSSSVEQESYDKTTDEWTWTRKVALNGEEIELKEVSDSLTYLENMEQYNWYQVKYNAEGEVIGVLDSDVGGTYDQWNLTGNEYVTNVSGLATAIDAEDTVLFTQRFTSNKMKMVGNVLYANTTDSLDNGFYVSDEVKVVLTQTNKNKTTTTFEVGAKALKNIVDTLNENNTTGYTYVLSAIIENGVATTVVVWDQTNNYERPEVVGENTFVNLTANGTRIYYIWDDTKMTTAPAEDVMLAQVIAELESNGMIVDKVSKAGSTYTFELSKMVGGSKVSLPNRTWDVTSGTLPGSIVTINGKAYLVDESNTRYDQIMDELGLTMTGTGVKLADGSYKAWGDSISLTDNSDDNKDAFTYGTTAATGYYKVSFTGYTVDNAPLAMKAGETVRVTITNGGWGAYVPTFNNGFVGSTVSHNATTAVVDLTAPATLAADISVNIGYTGA